VWGALLDECHQLSRLQLWQGVVACSCGQAVVARQGLVGPRGAGGCCPVQAGQHPWGRPAVCGAGLSWMAVLTVRGSLQRLANSCSRHHRDSSD
jgi:hypothetical protein